MANERRIRFDFQSGFVDDNPLAIGATTLTSAALQDFPAITSREYAVIVLDPRGVSGLPEIVWMTAHTGGATTGTIVRGREGTAARQHIQGTRWAHSATVFDHNYPKGPAVRSWMRQNFR